MIDAELWARRTLWYLMGFILGFSCSYIANGAPLNVARPVLYELTQADELFVEVPVIRKVDYGHQILDDIESRVRNDKWARPMRNRRDIGNWVHEQTHNLNAHIGIAKKAASKVHGWTGAYVLDGKAGVFLQPGIKLTDIRDAVPVKDRGGVYRDYLADRAAIKAWNEWPLYVLDEATAATNALAYERIEKGPHYLRRKALALDWASTCEYLLLAVEKGDPDYAGKDQLIEFVQWHNKRIRRLADVQIVPPPATKPNYKLY